MKRTTVTLYVQTFIEHKSDKDYQRRLNAFIKQLEPYGQVSVESEDRNEEQDEE
jgi:hypothetical protein